MISLLHATWGRPQKALAAMRDALAKASDPAQVEYVFAAEESDSATISAILGGDNQFAHLVSGPFNGSAPAWDAAARVCKGDLLVQMQDDLELPHGWDRMLWERIGDAECPRDPFGTPLFADKPPLVIHVSDGHRKDSLICTAIINRARYEQVGEFIHAGYQSVYSDDEFSIRAYADAADGKCRLIDARDIVFLHRHNYFDPTIPFDQTYQRENSPQAYAKGSVLFVKRNQHLISRGLKTW